MGTNATGSADIKAKRPRKRSRGKKRTADADNESDNDSDGANPEGAPSASATTKASSDKGTKTAKAAASSEEEDNADKTDADGKRKRKRKRSTKKKAENGDVAASAPTVEVGPDPSADLRLSEQAKQAISYAQTYVSNKTQWKFNKARQNWLLRNALSVPPADYDAALARKRSDLKSGEASNAEEDDEEGETFVPDDFVPVVAAYLKSVLGGAKVRLVQTLNEALQAAEVPVAPPMDAPATITDVAASEAPTTGKSVSFADMAMEQEGTQEQSKSTHSAATEEAVAPAGPDARTVELKRQRARVLLQQMGEAV